MTSPGKREPQSSLGVWRPQPPLACGTVVMRRPVEGRSVELFIVVSHVSNHSYFVAARQTNGPVFNTDDRLTILWAYQSLRLLSLALRAGQILNQNLMRICESGSVVDLRPSNREGNKIVEWFRAVIGDEPFREVRHMRWQHLPPRLQERHKSDNCG